MKNLIKCFASKYVIILLFIATNVMAQNGKNDNSLLWKISGNGLKEDSYILLTTSNLCKSTPLNGKITSVLNDVKYVCYEQGGKDPKNKSKVQGLVMVSSEQQSIKNNLSKPIYNSLIDKATEAGLDEKMVNMVKPCFLFTSIITKTIMECNTSVTKGYEDYIRDYVSKKALKYGDLYGFEEYVKLYDGYDKAFWDKTIGFLINNGDKMLKDLEVKENLYSQDNLNGIRVLYNSNAFLNARFLNSELEISRMKLCSSRIDVIVKAQSTLFVLDVGNVVNGKTSLFSFLNKMGYELSPVNTNL
jgi:uncharacterized protein